MLSCLTIDNIALIEHEEIKFSGGFVVFTGETGAGKSIIVDSIGLILGTRANKELIRSGADHAEVSALFENFNEIESAKLKNTEINTEDGQLLLSREIFSDGKSVSKINGHTVTLSMLRDTASVLVNIHGQHECQALTDSAHHLELLDLFADNKRIREKYYTAYKNAKSLQRQILDLSASEKEKKQRADYLKFVINEIGKVSPKKDELRLLEEKKSKIEKEEKVNSAVIKSLSMLNGGENGIGACGEIRNAASEIESVKDDIDNGSELFARLSAVYDEITDIYSEIARLGSIDEEYESVDNIQERMYALESLCRKYGGDVESVIETLNDANAELEEIGGYDKKLQALADKYGEAKNVLISCGEELSESRKSASGFLCKKVCDALEFLDMKGVKFYTDSKLCLNSKGSPFHTANGKEKIEFLISANIGEEPKPLAKIASGGELSRIILAIKSALNEKEGTGTLVFDEIDTGISGSTSYKVGIKLEEASRSSQVFCVTHSAQIASLADTHIKVSKYSRNGRSYSVEKQLDYDERISEIARIMGGDIISQALLESAKELIAHSGEIKKK